ncbi:MAG: hypothetical protein IPM52_13315 [Bacteroidetes bacterium]|nr:hypothetical protein [Bacteroidota bacterium]
MITYSLTSSAFEGEVIFDFDDNGLLVRYDASGANLTEGQQVFLLRRLPRELAQIKTFLENSPTARFTPIEQEISFEMFWNRYNEKLRSSKKKALKIWNRLSRADQIKAYRYITRYEQSVYPGTPKKYAETYLNAELWNN